VRFFLKEAEGVDDLVVDFVPRQMALTAASPINPPHPARSPSMAKAFPVDLQARGAGASPLTLSQGAVNVIEVE
jgi:hypothetical protein